jgi:DNA topoisomerase-3
LIITEKPSVARDIAAALGGFTEHEGYWEGEAYVLSFAVGHLFELLEPEEIDPEYKRWTLANLPILPEVFKLKPKSGHSERIRTLKKLLERKDVEAVINACDSGREGELIFREILKHFGIRKPVLRLWLQSMTAEAIRQGMETLRPGEELEGLAAAAECRAFSDWLIGMNATRALTKRLKSRREKGAWSAGRVQTPTLAILVDRELEVLAHVPRPYWRLVGRFAHAGAEYTGTWYDPAFAADEDEERRDDRLFDEARAQAILAAVSAAQSAVAEETRRPSRESAPPLFDLTSLQREGNRRFGWSARRTLSAAQRCYEQHKLLTYPRTDSRCLPSDYRQTVRGVLDSLSGARALVEGQYAAAAARLLRDGLENEARVFDDTGVSDHFAIIPTGKLPPRDLSGDDARLFDLVTRRFLGAFHPPALWEKVERDTVAAGQHFRTRARTLQEPGWRAVLDAGGDEDAVPLPPLAPGGGDAQGVAVAARAAALEAEETRPPARITEARLLSLMENAGQQVEDEDLAAVLHEKGIGTPATRADIIENLIGKGYVVRSGKALRPTVKGIRLIDTLRRIHEDRLASPALTGELEQHLRQVEHGGRAAATFMSEIEDYAREIVERARGFDYAELYADVGPLGACPRCGRDVTEKAWFYSCGVPAPAGANGKDSEEAAAARADECPMLFWKDLSGRYLDRGVVRALLRDGRSGVLDGFTARNGRIYKGVIEIDRDAWKLKVRSAGGSDDENVSGDPEYEVNPAPLGRCPFEEECEVVESPTQFVCERKLKEAELGKDEARPKSCGFVFPRTVCKREITREEACVYLQNKRTDLLTDFTSRFGRPFSATLVLKDNGRHGFEFPPRAPREGAPARRGRRGRAAEAPAETPDAAAAAGKPKRGAGPRKAAARSASTRSGPKRAKASAAAEPATAAKRLTRRRKTAPAGE